MVAREQERPGLNSSNTPEVLSLNDEVVFSKELTLKDLPGLMDNEETRRVGLDDAPFTYEVRDLGESFLHIASFSREHPLDSGNFLNLLSAAKSGGGSRAGQSNYEITGDWDIILPEVRARNPRKKELYDHHKKYVPNFSEFEENHFKKFWGAINALSAEAVKQEEDIFLIGKPDVL